jgi:hypothetical protein
MNLTNCRQVYTFNHILQFHIFTCANVLELNCVRMTCRESRNALWNRIFRIKNLYAVEYGRICNCLISLHFLCAAHILHCFAECFCFPWQDATLFSTLCLLMSPDSLPGRFCLHYHGTGFFIGCGVSHLNWTHFWYDSSLLSFFLKFTTFNTWDKTNQVDHPHMLLMNFSQCKLEQHPQGEKWHSWQ